MSWIRIILILLPFILFSCQEKVTDMSLDELEDMQTYTGGFVVDATSFGGESTTRILVNREMKEDPETLNLSASGYYHIEVHTRNRQAPALIRVVILHPERGESEWALQKWTPRGLDFKQEAGEAFRLVYPEKIPSGGSLPVILISGETMGTSGEQYIASVGDVSFQVKGGTGSAWIRAGMEQESLEAGSTRVPLDYDYFSTDPVFLSGVMEGNRIVAPGTYVRIPSDLHIPEGLSLVFEEGCYVELEEGVNIHNQGQLVFRGGPDAPLCVRSTATGTFWGGIIGTGQGNSVEAQHTIFSHSGFHTGGAYDYGHAHRQALIYSEYGSLIFDHCYFLDHAGQVFFPVSGSLDLSNSLVQRAITGGQVNSSQLQISHCVFTDFPDDRLEYQDRDNDGLYLMSSNAEILNSTFMYAGDDGLDSGGSGGGKVRVSGCLFQSIFHEGAALSSGGEVVKEHIFTHCEFRDCGQGLELGYSSPHHRVKVDSCLFTRNGIGIRYGDNYTKAHLGLMEISHTLSIENRDYDVWNMLREYWEPSLEAMVFDEVTVSRPHGQYPELKLYDN